MAGFLDWLLGTKPKTAPKGKTATAAKGTSAPTRSSPVQRGGKLPAKNAPQLTNNEKARDVLKQWMNEKEDHE